MAEQELRRAVQITDGDFMTLIEKPFSIVIYTLLILGIAIPKIWPMVKKRMASK
jgi:putative tricarboxylic transport membrane protein